VPGDSEANIDHVVVASTGVWIIDSKKWTGEIRYRSPGFPSTDPRKCLTVDGKDRTSEIAKIYRLVIPVAQVIGIPKFWCTRCWRSLRPRGVSRKACTSRGVRGPMSTRRPYLWWAQLHQTCQRDRTSDTLCRGVTLAKAGRGNAPSLAGATRPTRF